MPMSGLIMRRNFGSHLVFQASVLVCFYLRQKVYMLQCPSVGRAVCRSVGPSIRRSVGPSVRRSVGPSNRLSIVLWVLRSVGPSVCRCVGPSVSRSVGPSVGNLFFRRAETKTANDFCRVSGLVFAYLGCFEAFRDSLVNTAST